MTCTQCLTNLNAVADNEVGWITRTALGLHLLRCPRCRAELHAIHSLSQQLGSLPVPAPSETTRALIIEAARRPRSLPEKASPRPIRLLAFGFLAVLLPAVALILSLAARPAPAQAALARVIAAAEGVETCHMVLWFHQPGGMLETHHTWFAHGQWRLDAYRGDELTSVRVYDGLESHFYDPQTDTVWRSVSDKPFGTPFRGFTVGAMLETMGDDEVLLDQVRSADGQLLNRFTITDHGLGERVVVLADPKTHLPVSMEVYARLTSAWELVGGTERIAYNLPADPGLFVLKPPDTARVINRMQMVEQWQRRYDEGMLRVQLDGDEVILRDFQVTETGDVYAIWSPGALDTDAQLADNLGTTYLRISEGFRAGHDPSAWFVPLMPPASAVASYELTVALGPQDDSRDDRHVTFHVHEPVLSPTADPIYPIPEHTEGPVYFFWQEGPTAAVTRAEKRAEYWTDHGELLRAIGCFEDMVSTADRELSPTYVAPTTWLKIGSLYEQVGKPQAARKAYERGIKAYRGEDWYKGTVVELRSRLKDLP